MTSPRSTRRGPLLRHPAQYTVATFAITTLLGSILLALPIAARSGRGVSYTSALFTATSATCVTGLTVVDTETTWAPFGQAVLLVLIQIGGLGTMTLTSLLLVALSGKLRLRHTLVAAAQTGTTQLGDVRRLVRRVVLFAVSVEAIIALVLFGRFAWGHGESVGRSAWMAVFHSVSAFNNAGFGLLSDNLTSFRNDPTLLVIIASAVVIGGLGYPVVRDVVLHARHPRRWALHSKITVSTTIVLLVAGTVLMLWFEWSNPATLGAMSAVDSVTNGFFQSASTRTAGFNALNIAELEDNSKLLTMILMFIGGGSASTAGGIKVTTFAVLGWVMWAEIRGDRDVSVLRRRVPTSVQRQALTVALMALGVVVAATLVLGELTALPLLDVAFESVSALGTVGLSPDVTSQLPVAAQLLVTMLMFVGRVGPPTLAAALVLKRRDRMYRFAEEPVLIG